MKIDDIITAKTIRQLQYRYDLLVTEAVYIQTQKATFPRCPRCHTTLSREYMSYCDQCGQKLSWKKWHRVQTITI